MSPARISPLRVRERESQDGGLVFGLRCGELLGTYDRGSSSLRTLERSLFEDLTLCLVRLPRSGMMRSGRIYEQRTWVLRTGGSGSGLLPTPTSKANQNAPSMRDRDKGSWFRTPNTFDSLDAKSQEALNHEYTHREGRAEPNNLRDQIAVREGQRQWPTPTDMSKVGGTTKYPTPRATDGNKPAYGDKNHQGLQARIALPESKNPGQLNPTWVDWLMGYETGWTDLEDSGMQLSLK